MAAADNVSVMLMMPLGIPVSPGTSWRTPTCELTPSAKRASEIGPGRNKAGSARAIGG
jgi:hypothetical protein